MRIEPALLVIHGFGGVRATARRLEIDPSNVSRWMKSGRVPSSQQRKILELAWQNNVDLTAHDLIMGRE